MIKKVVSIFLVIIVVSYSVDAQPTTGFAFQDIIKPSANAANFPRYGNTTVDYSRGIVQQKIELLSLSEGPLKHTVSLMYNQNGIKVEDAPSWVGSSWFLNAGGVIIRETRGTEDERYIYGNIKSKSFPKFDFNPSTWSNVTNTFRLDKAVYDEDEKNWACGTDTSPDKFIFNFSGYQGYFFINKDGFPVSDKFKIKYTETRRTEESVYTDITSWEAIGKDGTIYLFEQPEKSSSVYGGNTWRCRGGNSALINTAWYLTKIISADGKNRIEFEYDLTYKGNKSIRNSKNEYYQIISNCGEEERSYQAVYADLYAESIFLSKIKTSELTVSFYTSATNVKAVKRRLDKIEIKSSDEAIPSNKKQIEFLYKDCSPASATES
ncbi:hypothetical protein [Ohtaekwangia koreensis]|uniref:YD repeat-containing protein n=1 Tax=Ohtaekwangia koreensis TaxID=688867 RepID=A0A1T5LEP3_9BACT|nr:hypothetical protein [Ohtaekwangia koreensis]SKC74324.1 hypothetical protein SAMN05660236_3055 [Ohtaekwangia koreensis]